MHRWKRDLGLQVLRNYIMGKTNPCYPYSALRIWMHFCQYHVSAVSQKLPTTAESLEQYRQNSSTSASSQYKSCTSRALLYSIHAQSQLHSLQILPFRHPSLWASIIRTTASSLHLLPQTKQQHQRQEEWQSVLKHDSYT